MTFVTGNLAAEEHEARREQEEGEWSGSPDPNDPDNFWIDDKSGERVDARTGEKHPQ